MKNKMIKLANMDYTVEENYKDCIDEDELQSLFTEYFYNYDYVLGDYSYNKLRLKGFYNSNNKNSKKINDIKGYKTYLKDFCAIDCPYFLLKKQISIEKE